LGPAHVCRVLGKCVQNEHECCLVTFFQTERSPCYVPSEYLFELQSHIVFPLGDEEKFKEYMLNEDVCVDWLLERIFSAAQNIGAIYHAEVLFPFDPAKEATFRPTPQQVQQLMFQCVSLAALLIVCYVAGKWTIPEGKLGLILSTILRTSAPKYTSTQNIMSKVEDLLAQLLSIRKE
jgi:hypothetical protein